MDDFSSPKELAAYLKYLDGNDTAYQEYQAWKFDYERTCPSLNLFCNFCQKLYYVQGNTADAKSTPWGLLFGGFLGLVKFFLRTKKIFELKSMS